MRSPTTACPQLYNEPFLGYYDGMSASAVADCFANGGCEARLNDGKGSRSGHKVEGVSRMLSAVRANAPDGVIVLAGPGGWAYETSALVRYARDAPGGIIFNLHPYMGPYQDCDPAFDKTPAGFANSVAALRAARRPTIITEFGQYCCPDPANEGVSSGGCSDGAGAAGASYDGLFEGKPTGYNDAILSVAGASNVSWTAWAWVPGGTSTAGGSCAFPMVNDGGTRLIGYDRSSVGHGSLSSAAKCDSSITIRSASHGANITHMWHKHYPPPPLPPPPLSSATMCPAGSIRRCIVACPTKTPAAYEACLKSCLNSCPPTVEVEAPSMLRA